MKLLVIRHAVAQDKSRFAKTGSDDGARPLTERGRRRMRAGARGLHRLAPKLDLLATSPLTRAAQTTEIVAAAYPGPAPKTVTVPQLAPRASVQSVLKWLQTLKKESTVAIVGHEPQLGVLVSWLLTGLQESFVEMKKGGACLLELTEEVRPARARLRWLLSPAQLRRLGSE
jgi:phosphohistidine phosphatase